MVEHQANHWVKKTMMDAGQYTWWTLVNTNVTIITVRCWT